MHEVIDPHDVDRSRTTGARRFFIVLGAIAFAPMGAAAQRPAACDSVAPPVVSPQARVMRTAAPAGQAVYAPPGSPHEDIIARGVCVALFDRAGGLVVRGDSTDEHGLFAFDTLPPGEYVLVAGMPSLHLAAQPIRVPTDRSRLSATRLLVHLRSRADSRPSTVTLVSNPALRHELLDRLAQDQRVRYAMIAAGADHLSPEVLARIDSLAAANQARMRTIVAQHGWPRRDLVGMDGSEAAFILVQHAGHLFQRQMLPIVEGAYRSGDLSGQDLALLTDRVLVGDGKPQRYGTQAVPIEKWVNRRPVLQPIEDSVNVDRRRAALGLQPLQDYVDALKRMYIPKRPSTPRPDSAAWSRRKLTQKLSSVRNHI